MGRSRNRSTSKERDRHSRSMSSSSSGRAAKSATWDGEQGHRLHVSDLTVGISRKEVEKIFTKFGPVNEVWVATNPPCFAFINYKHRSDGEQAIRELDGKVIGSSRVGVSWARNRTYGGRGRSSSRPSYSGGGGRGGYRGSSFNDRGGDYRGSSRRGGYQGRRNSRSRSNSREDRYRKRSRSPRGNRQRSLSRDNRRSPSHTPPPSTNSGSRHHRSSKVQATRSRSGSRHSSPPQPSNQQKGRHSYRESSGAEDNNVRHKEAAVDD